MRDIHTHACDFGIGSVILTLMRVILTLMRVTYPLMRVILTFMRVVFTLYEINYFITIYRMYKYINCTQKLQAHDYGRFKKLSPVRFFDLEVL
jgi:hypothetical protein